jgi:hypothetical protein
MEEYLTISIARANGDISISPAYILSEICSEHFLGRCDKLVDSKIEFCRSCQECEVPHEFVLIKQVEDKK